MFTTYRVPPVSSPARTIPVNAAANSWAARMARTLRRLMADPPSAPVVEYEADMRVAGNRRGAPVALPQLAAGQRQGSGLASSC